MKQISKNKIRKKVDEIKLFCVVKNEQLRLPYFLEYYKKLGVDRFFFIDNSSFDKTKDMLLKEKKIHVFYTDQGFENKKEWLNNLTQKYALNSWCIIVDCDELFIYPYYEKVSLRKLCSYLDKNNYGAMYSILLDMFPDRSLGQVQYKVGQDFLLTHNYFDPLLKTRQKVFKLPKVLFDKFPLLKINKHTEVWHGQHKILGSNIADIHGAVLHFKFLHDFFEKKARELKDSTKHMLNLKEIAYSGYAKECLQYYEICKNNKEIILFDKDSIKFTGSKQLLNLFIMKSSRNYDEFMKQTF